MAIQPERITVEAEGLTVSRIIWRRFRRRVDGLAERVYALNPGLADLGIILPVGTVLLLPVDRSEPATTQPALISLWD